MYHLTEERSKYTVFELTQATSTIPGVEYLVCNIEIPNDTTIITETCLIFGFQDIIASLKTRPEFRILVEFLKAAPENYKSTRTQKLCKCKIITKDMVKPYTSMITFEADTY